MKNDKNLESPNNVMEKGIELEQNINQDTDASKSPQNINQHIVAADKLQNINQDRNIIDGIQNTNQTFDTVEIRQNFRTQNYRSRQKIERYQLSDKEDELLKRDISFPELVDFLYSNPYCLNMGCTTCGCMGARNLFRKIGRYRINAMLSTISAREIYDHYGLHWHDMIRLIVLTLGENVISDTLIGKQHLYINSEYYRYRHYLGLTHSHAWDVVIMKMRRNLDI